ncbi:hypothetical protein GC176_07540 [bacterium]|nr:hypothetical protein [bacterium]
MSDLLTLELSNEQRETLLRGLRYVRSSIMLTPEEPSAAVTAGRKSELQKVAALSELLNGQTVTEKASV